ncbi:MAG TPA: multidrug transporter [Gammaproteobacteria bacterium]|nr:multidrug transporter [Gammaproteobacteria bacterium]
MSLSARLPSLPLIAAGGLAVAIYFVWSSLPVPIEAAPVFAPPESRFEHRVAAVGLIETASENIAIAPALPGLVTEVHVQAGARVVAGAPLFTQDSRDLAAERSVRTLELAQAEAELARLRAAPRRETLPPLRARVEEARQRLNDARVQLEMLEAVDDPRAVRREDRVRREIGVKAAEAALATASGELALAEAGTWAADRAVAESAVALARARLVAVDVAIERLTVRAPRDGVVLKVDVRPGEFAEPTRRETPLITFGDDATLHVRTEVDEYEAHRLVAGAAAEASPRGNAAHRLRLEFVRVEPYVIPRRQLTGDVTQRVDTRVLQVIYRIADASPGLHVGQQMDVFIAADAQSASGELAQE